MNILEIINKDFDMHHKDVEYPATQAVDIIRKFVAVGGKLYKTDKCLFTYFDNPTDTLDVHSMNAGTGKDLSDSVNEFLNIVPDRYSFITTHYKNPRITNLSKYFSRPCDVVTTEDGGFKMTIHLRKTNECI